MSQSQNIEQQIQLLGTLALVFGILALLLLAIAVFLFIYLHIPQVFNEYRGKSARKELEAMAANSAESGNLVSSHSSEKKKSSSHGGRHRRYTENLTEEISQEMAEPYRPGQNGTVMLNETAKPEQPVLPTEGAEATNVLSAEEIAGMEETNVLTPEAQNGAAETSVLEAVDLEDAGETEVLTPQPEEEQVTTILSEAEAAATEVLKMPGTDGSETTGVLKMKGAMAKAAISEPEPEGTMVLDQAMLTKARNLFEVERSIILIHTEKVIE